jgi:hypothetical protein
MSRGDQGEETAFVPSMSARARTTRVEVARIAEANIEQMTMQLDQWGTRLEALVAEAFEPGADARTGHHEAIEALKTKYEMSRARFAEFKSAGGTQWRLFRSGIERSWTDFENALEKLTNRLVHGNEVEGELPDDPCAP